MGTLLRRRYMGGGSADEIIMTSVSNPEVMAICYAQGWAANADYMTKREAEAVSSIGTVFKGKTAITSFTEFQYFTGVNSIATQGFRGCSGMTEITLPNSIRSIGQSAFQSCGNLTSFTVNEGCTSTGQQWIWDCSKIVLIEFPSTITTLTGYGIQPYKANHISYNVKIYATTPPSLGNSGYATGLQGIYVPDGSVDAYKAKSVWSDFATKIKPLSEYIPS